MNDNNTVTSFRAGQRYKSDKGDVFEIIDVKPNARTVRFRMVERGVTQLAPIGYEEKMTFHRFSALDLVQI